MSPQRGTVAFLSSMHPPFDKRVFAKEAISLAAAGYRVIHLCPSDEDERSVDTRDGVEFIHVPRKAGWKGRLSMLRSLVSRGRRLDCDAYHCNEVDSWMVGVLLGFLTGRKVVFDVHEEYPTTFGEHRLPRPLRPLAAAAIRLLFRVLLPFTDGVVLAKSTVSTDFRTAHERTILVRNFAFRRPAREVPPRAATNEFRVIHVGLISRTRGAFKLLEALALLPEHIVLHVIGTFNMGSPEEFWSSARKLGVASRIRVDEWMPFEQMMRAIEESDAGIVAFQPGIQNHRYAMPHKLFDYMSAGKPVIVPEFAEEVAPIIAGEKCGFLVDSADPRSIADAIRRLDSDRAMAASMGRAGRDAVEKTYNWETEAGTLIRFYHERLLGR